MPLSVKKISASILMLLTFGACGQGLLEPADSLNNQRAVAIGAAQVGLSSATLIGLQFAWYHQHQNGQFRFFNDWPGWSQMDKIGHAATAYQIGTGLYNMNRWVGISKNKSAWYAVGLGYSYLFAVEVMDGFSSGWGFSNYDLLFNTIGSGGFLAQQLGWNEQRIRIKYSFSSSGLTSLPGAEGQRARNLYGATVFEQWLKDYNGQTYWVSANIWSLIGKPARFPKWLSMAAGYSVNNLFGAESNTWTDPDNAEQTITSGRMRQRQLLLSLDIELQHVDLPKSLVWLKPVFGLVKIPFPALEWNDQKGFDGHWLYF